MPAVPGVPAKVTAPVATRSSGAAGTAGQTDPLNAPAGYGPSGTPAAAAGTAGVLSQSPLSPGNLIATKSSATKGTAPKGAAYLAPSPADAAVTAASAAGAGATPDADAVQDSPAVVPTPQFTASAADLFQFRGVAAAAANHLGVTVGAASSSAAGPTGNDGDTEGAGDAAAPTAAGLGAAAAIPTPAAPAPTGETRASATTATAAAGTPNAPDAPLSVANIAVTIAAEAHAGNSRFDIRLDPPDLGRVNVQLSVDSSGNVSSRLIVERPDTLDLLRRDAPQLERSLRDAGLNANQGMQFTLADQGFAGRNWFVPQNDFSAGTRIGTRTEDATAAVAGYAGSPGRGGGLDITV